LDLRILYLKSIIREKILNKQLFDYSLLKKYDPSGMHKVYDQWPMLAKESYHANYTPLDFDEIDHIVFSGMGGSGAIGDTISAILSKSKTHITTVKGYQLPNTVDSNTLVIATSVSGNTTETLTVLDSAKKLGCKLVAFSSGGKMERFCTKNNIEFRKIPMIHSPRASFSKILYSMLKSLENIIPIKKGDVEESIHKLENLQSEITSSNLTETNPSLRLANWINGFPVIYYPWGLQAVAIRFKNSLQENVKLHCYAEDVIEACHNGVVSWEKPSNAQPILIQGEDDHIKTKERWKILKEFFETKNIDYQEIFSVKGNILSKIINLIYQLDYSTIYQAVSNKTNPAPIPSIDFIKERS